MPSSSRQAVVCPSCRRLVAGDVKVCPFCKYRQPTLFGLSGRLAKLFRGPRSLARMVLLANVFITGALMLLSVVSGAGGDNSLSRWATGLPSQTVSRSFGALVGRDVVFDHEWWRLITCLFIHQGIIHLLFNMFVLRMLGPATENFYGKARFVLIYFGSGIFASLASLFGHGLATFSVGASGAIMGLLGALAIYGRRRGDAMGQALFRQTSIWALMILGLGLLLPQFRTDNWAHAGGLVAGVALGAVFSGRALVQRVEGPRERLSALSTLAIAGICLLLGFTHLVIGGQKDSDRLLAAQRVWPQYRHYVSVLAQLPDGRSAAIKAEDARAMASFAPVFRGAAEALGEEGEWLLPLVEEQTKLRDLLQWDRPEGEIRDQARRVGKMMDTAPWGKQLPP